MREKHRDEDNDQAMPRTDLQNHKTILAIPQLVQAQLARLQFQKKSKHGIATPKQDIELIETRLKRAKEHHDQYYKQRLEEDGDERGN